MTRHRHAGKNGPSPEYRSWQAMIQRCTNADAKDFPRYGGRGICVCDRWRDFTCFLADMGERPLGTSLDRWPDVRGHYEPGNCRWATQEQQQRNKSTALCVEIGGVRKHLKEWCEERGVLYATARTRLRRGWSPAEALEV